MAVMQGSEEIMVDKIEEDKTDSQIHLDNESRHKRNKIIKTKISGLE